MDSMLVTKKRFPNLRPGVPGFIPGDRFLETNRVNVGVDAKSLPRGWDSGLRFVCDWHERPKGGQVGIVERVDGRVFFGRMLYGRHDVVLAIQPLHKGSNPIFLLMGQVKRMGRVVEVYFPADMPIVTQGKVSAAMAVPDDHNDFKKTLAALFDLNNRCRRELKALEKSSGTTPIRQLATLGGNREMKDSRELAAVA